MKKGINMFKGQWFNRVVLFICSIFPLALCQVLTFHNPMPWLTLRQNKIVAKILIDTAEVKSAVELKLFHIKNGNKKLIKKETFKTTDYSHEYEFPTINQDIVGGND